MKVGDILFVRNSDLRVVVVSLGWCYNEGYPSGPFFPWGGGVGVATDCGWIWEPRVYRQEELNSWEESARHMLALARQEVQRGKEARLRADRFIARAEYIIKVKEPIDVSNGVK